MCIRLFTYHNIHGDVSGRAGSEQADENKVTVMMVANPPSFYTQFCGPSINEDRYTFGKGFSL